MEEPLTLQILRIIQQFSPKGLPVSFLYQKLPASREDIAAQVRALAEQGAIRMDGDQVRSMDP